MIKLLTVVLLTVTCMAGQALPVCPAVSEDDARSILGASARRTQDPSGCEWQDHSARAAIYLLRGPAVLIVDIDGFEAGGADGHLPQVRDLVRKLASKL